MVAREKMSKPSANLYFAQEKPLEFFSSGCLTLDLALGGGWAEQRVANVVGDRSTGKTLIAIEGMTNFSRKYPDGNIIYRETEAAFDADYAAALGLPLDRVDFGKGKHRPDDAPKLETVEDLFDDVEDMLAKADEHTYYIVDSLDGLSDRAEQGRKLAEGTYGTAKAKLLSEFFRTKTARLANKRVTVLMISQIRSNINAMAFAKKWVRAGGKALDFYSSQVLYLKQTGLVQRKIKQVERATGIKIEARLEKNKVGLPFRSAEFEIMFGYGIDDMKASVIWLDKNIGKKYFDGVDPAKVITAMRNGDQKLIAKINKAVTSSWYDLEKSFLPPKGKYEA